MMMEEVEHQEVATENQSVSPEKISGSGEANVIIQPSAEPSQLPEQESANSEMNGSDSQGSSWGFTGWLKSASNNQFVQKVMEKTKTGVDKMITTLDPGMMPYIKEGGDIYVVVTSDKEVKWGAVRDAFQNVFGVAVVKGVASQSNIAPQPVGYTAGVKGAQERIKHLRKCGLVDEKQLCVSVESFVVEQLPDHWYDVGCVMIDDPSNNIKFQVFTMAIPVDLEVVTDMQKATPSDYDLRWSGLAATVGETVQKQLPWIKPSDWHKALTGQSRRDMIYSASLLLAELYKRKLPEKSIEQEI